MSQSCRHPRLQPRLLQCRVCRDHARLQLLVLGTVTLLPPEASCARYCFPKLHDPRLKPFVLGAVPKGRVALKQRMLGFHALRLPMQRRLRLVETALKGSVLLEDLGLR